MTQKTRSNLVGMQAGTNSWFRSQFLKPGTRRWYKKQSHRKMRRLAKRDPENAPQVYRYAGWAD